MTLTKRIALFLVVGFFMVWQASAEPWKMWRELPDGTSGYATIEYLCTCDIANERLWHLSEEVWKYLDLQDTKEIFNEAQWAFDLAQEVFDDTNKGDIFVVTWKKRIVVVVNYGVSPTDGKVYYGRWCKKPAK